MSFLRQGKIYRNDRKGPGAECLVQRSRGDHRFDESSTGYSLAGCAPAEPPSASPAFCSFLLFSAVVHSAAANGNLSLISLSQARGALQCVQEARSHLIPDFREAPGTAMPAPDPIRAAPFAKKSPEPPLSLRH